eukprot:14994054-Heterocapsa_arctica.AAC.1
MVDELKFTSVWYADHGHFWRNPETGDWMRLAVDNFVPKLGAHSDQSGIDEALAYIFRTKAGCIQARSATAMPVRVTMDP